MKSKKSFHIGAGRITLEDVQEVAREGRKVELSPAAIKRIRRSYEFLQKSIRDNKIIYGVNTGFGSLSSVTIPPRQIEELQLNFLRSHAMGAGKPVPADRVRAMLFLRAAALSTGNSGVSLKVVQGLLALLNRDIVPVVPEQGSLGASGDLAPLAHLSLVLIGEGRAYFKGREMSGLSALRAAGLKPIRLGPKEGLALTNGTQLMSSYGVLNLLDAEQLCDLADVAGSLSLEALRGTAVCFDPLIHAIRPHPGQIAVAKRMLALLGGQKKSEISRSHENCGKVQDPYSLRCIPQVHGATRDVLAFVRQVLEREINSVTDNPLVFPEEGRVLSGGNFHGQILAIAADTLSIAVAELASISEQRIDKLVNPIFSNLPPYLTPKGGLNSGFMIVQYTAASIVSENKTLCHPATVDTIATSQDKEDHVSMGAWAARKASLVVENTRRVLAMELLAGAQGIEFLRPLKTSPRLEKALTVIRAQSPRVIQDRSLHEDVRQLENVIYTGAFDRI